MMVSATIDVSVQMDAKTTTDLVALSIATGQLQAAQDIVKGVCKEVDGIDLNPILDEFDKLADWVSFRTTSLLEKLPVISSPASRGDGGEMAKYSVECPVVIKSSAFFHVEAETEEAAIEVAKKLQQETWNNGEPDTALHDGAYKWDEAFAEGET